MCIRDRNQTSLPSTSISCTCQFGFKVESIEAVKRDMEELTGVNPLMVTKPLGYGSEGKARLDVFKQCPIGQFHLTDLEGVYVDCHEGA